MRKSDKFKWEPLTENNCPDVTYGTYSKPVTGVKFSRASLLKIVERFLSHKKNAAPKNFWPCEMKAAKILLGLYDENFWMAITPPGEKINSLNWFQTEWGIRYLKQEEVKLRLVESQRKLNEVIQSKKQIESQVEIPVEDYNIKKKPSNPLEFITYG